MPQESGNGAGAPWVAGQPLTTSVQPAPGEIGVSPSSVPVEVADPAEFRIPRTDETENPVPSPVERVAEAPRLHAVEGRDTWDTVPLTEVLTEQRIINQNIANPVTGVTVTPTTASVAVGATTTIVPTVAPAAAPKDLTWTSADPAKATVSQAGVVTGVAAGTGIVITATSKADGSKKATATIAVTA